MTNIILKKLSDYADAIQAEVAEAIESLKAFIISKKPEIVAFLRPTAELLEKDGKEFIVNAVKAAVLAAEAAGGTGADKRNAVLASVASTVKHEGLEFVETEVRQFIQTVLINLKITGSVQ